MTPRSLFADQAFRTGLVLQAIAAFWSCHGLYRALRHHTPEALRLKRHFALVFMRWMAVLMTMYFGLSFVFGQFAPLFFVVVYTVATIVIDVDPDRFLRAMPGGEDNLDLPPGKGKSAAMPPRGEPHPPTTPQPGGHRRHRRRR